MKRLISIVIPAYNEEAVIDELTRRLKEFISGHEKYDFEIIIVENGSDDKTFEKLQQAHGSDPRFKILQLSRNFGPDGAITAGLRHASGDASVIMNADLQDPPEVITEFIKKWEQGYEIVYGIVRKRTENPFRKFLYFIFYRLISKLTGGLLPKDASDFRLIDKKVYEAVNILNERNRYIRGMIIWTGFRQTGVIFDRAQRFAGKPKSRLLLSLKIALNGIFAFSFFPLRLATCLGFVMSLGSFILILVFVVQFIFWGRDVPGLYTTWTLISFLFGMLFLMLGIVGEYIARIYDEVKQRPNYIIKDGIGFK